MVRWNMECVLILANQMSLVILSRVWFGSLLAGGVSATKPNITGDGD